MEFVERYSPCLRDWIRLTGHNPNQFGPESSGLIYRPKDHHVGVRDDNGDLAALVGATIATVEVAGYGPFEVVGLGALIVREDMRGRGIARQLIGRMRAIIGELGPDRGMLFCEPSLMPLYARVGYAPISGQVRVDQPGGRVEMPMPAMWRALRPAEWPPGTVDLHGFPF